MASPDIHPPLDSYDLEVETLIIGAGACGLVAGLSAHGAGQDVLIVEADAVPTGSTALSAGLIPAAGTRFQRAIGIEDTAQIFAQDIQDKASHENDPALVGVLADGAAGVIEWLADTHGLPFTLVDNFDYPGHQHKRMHGLPTRSGAELVDALRARVDTLGVPLVCNRRAVTLHLDGKTVDGVTLARPDGAAETVRTQRVVLACNGFGGNRTMVRDHMPDIADALWFGHDGNTGDAIAWGQTAGAQLKHLGAYQGHGNVAYPHGILITWAVITQGGFQVNTNGERFWNESQGYSEAARHVLRQPEGVAWTIFDTRIADVARQFADFKEAEKQNALVHAPDIPSLAKMLGLEADALTRTFDQIPASGTDALGRSWDTAPSRTDLVAVKVTGALFHTQGGLVIDPETAKVRHTDGDTFANLYAAGGAACGVSGAGDSGYLSGNGLLAAVVLGYIAGRC
ncbi:FAD-dependent oxidoreductase [Sulfitobacter sp. S190]|uniref:FAD-dependent oxidoreductase n=1 Tax=Sulfitobacter sp. S190 TaxID=2867022 RepID=UPI0021A6E258|nr:FAD-dependent oxidoreductase [Sulfitobacter sp. S190]UWR24286.1 FAD-dependent oxidoreductase [Sulfitobacter sp. S190]